MKVDQRWRDVLRHSLLHSFEELLPKFWVASFSQSFAFPCWLAGGSSSQVSCPDQLQGSTVVPSEAKHCWHPHQRGRLLSIGGFEGIPVKPGDCGRGTVD